MQEDEDLFPPLTIESLIEMVKQCNEEGFKIYRKGALIDYSFTVHPPATMSEIKEL
ncbi:hypothetical protein [Paenibacillus agilis]|uniref:hypothetical protein n=1 Tax=Paenibacillus agilis TaxID=3020863 RepID=UPI001649BBBE|nr:hypothetical protein [Paenibacillus agilis]